MTLTRLSFRLWLCSALSLLASACGDSPDGDVDQGVGDQGAADQGGRQEVPAGPWYERGAEGVANPLAGTATRAMAGRATAAMLPDFHSGLQTWREGDFILANDRVAIVIEDVGPSDLYDPWGGRPVGLARVESGALVEPADFGELFIAMGRMTVVTEYVDVLNDGANGEAAVVRAQGLPAGIPVLDTFLGGIFRVSFSRIPTAIDYVLEPGAEHVDIYLTHTNYDEFALTAGTMHGFMYGLRMPTFNVGQGFNSETRATTLAFVDDRATSWAYRVPDSALAYLTSDSGFTGMTAPGYVIAASDETRRHFARIYIGGRGLDGVLAAVARTEGDAQRVVNGAVFEADGVTPAVGVRVHAELPALSGGDSPIYLTRATTGADGLYSLHVPAAADVQLTAYRRGDSVVGPTLVQAATGTHDITMGASGFVHVTAVDVDRVAPDNRLPVRVQMVPAGSSVLPSVPDNFGEPSTVSGRLHVEYAVGSVGAAAGVDLGEATLRAPPGDWEVIVSRGTEYTLARVAVTVVAGAVQEVPTALRHIVATDNVQCADFHVHTHRSNDSGDPVTDKLRSAVADGLDIPSRSEHEFIALADPEIVALGLGTWAYGLTSSELSTFQVYGHFGVLPARPSAGVNNGAVAWQTYPSAADPTAPIELISPPVLFDSARARPEAPAIIVNHPRRGNYFDYVGLDPLTGQVENLDAWDTEFRLVEVFNGSGWKANRDGTVRDWFALLNIGRPMFAVGSSDSHAIRELPVGYPRTCLAVGTDNPRALTDDVIRDATQAGHSSVSGGVFVQATLGSASHGDTVTGVAATEAVRVVVQAAPWVQGDFVMDVIVDGEVVETIDINDAGVDDSDPVLHDDVVNVPVGATRSWVVFAVYSTTPAPLAPVHPGHEAFGVTNPLFLVR